MRPTLVRDDRLRVAGLATGLADNAVSLFHEQRLHPEASERWVSRCRTQIQDVLAALQEDRAARATRHWLGDDSLSPADIAVACAPRFLAESHADPAGFDLSDYPALAAHSAVCEGLPVFQKISRPFSG